MINKNPESMQNNENLQNTLNVCRYFLPIFGKWQFFLPGNGTKV